MRDSIRVGIVRICVFMVTFIGRSVNSSPILPRVDDIYTPLGTLTDIKDSPPSPAFVPITIPETTYSISIPFSERQRVPVVCLAKSATGHGRVLFAER